MLSSPLYNLVTGAPYGNPDRMSMERRAVLYPCSALHAPRSLCPRSTSQVCDILVLTGYPPEPCCAQFRRREIFDKGTCAMLGISFGLSATRVPNVCVDDLEAQGANQVCLHRNLGPTEGICCNIALSQSHSHVELACETCPGVSRRTLAREKVATFKSWDELRSV